MITLDSIKAEWASDSKLNPAKIDDELVRLPSLHAKYLGYYLSLSDEQVKIKASYNRMRNLKRRYYRGELDRETLVKYEWTQWQHEKIKSLAELNTMFEIDYDLIKMNEVIERNEIILKTLESILWNIRDRGHQLKTLFDYQKFISGG